MLVSGQLVQVWCTATARYVDIQADPSGFRNRVNSASLGNMVQNRRASEKERNQSVIPEHVKIGTREIRMLRSAILRRTVELSSNAAVQIRKGIGSLHLKWWIPNASPSVSTKTETEQTDNDPILGQVKRYLLASRLRDNLARRRGTPTFDSDT